MMNYRIWDLLYVIPIIANCCFSSPSVAEDAANRGRSLSFELSAGIEHDNNISVQEIDVITRKGDFSGVFAAEVEYEKELSENTDLSVSYDFFQSLRFQYTDYNLQIHNLTGQINHDFGRIDSALAYVYVYAKLDGNGFLSFQRISPSFSGFLSKSVFVRTAFDYTEKDFEQQADRDSEVLSPNGSAYYFFNGHMTYLVAGYRYEDEDAKDRQYSFNGNVFRIGLSHKLSLLNRVSKLTLGYRYRDRNYRGITPSSGRERHDKRRNLEAGIEVLLNEKIFCSLEYEFQNNASNLDFSDYKQHVVSFRIGARF